MKKIAEMSPEELLEYCFNLKKNGSSFRELANLFEQNNIDAEVRKNIIKSLDGLDKQQRIEKDRNDKLSSKTNGITKLVIGIVALVFGFVLFKITAESGVIFIFNIVIWAFGGLMVIRGIVGLLKSN